MIDISTFLLILVGPLLWAIGNHIDTFLISKYFKDKGVGTLLIFSSIIGLITLPVLVAIRPEVFDISLTNSVFLLIDGVLSVVVMWLYFKSLESNTASSVVPMYQITPVFVYIFGYFVLGELLGMVQLFAMFLIVAGAFILSIEGGAGLGIKINYRATLFMLVAVTIAAFQAVLFKFVILEEDFWVSFFWYYVGLSLIGCSLLIFHKQYRSEFFESIKKNSKIILGLNILNELMTIIGTVIFTYTYLYVPVTVTNLLGSYQSVFVLVIGIVLSRFMPKLTNEKFTTRTIIQKFAAILLMMSGTYFLLV